MFLSWLEKYFGICNHKWITIARGPMVDGTRLYGHYYHQECSKCGKLQIKELKGSS